MVQFLIIDFPKNICEYDYYIIRLLCGNYMSLYCSMLTTGCINATVPSIKYFNCRKNRVAFHPINWELTQGAYIVIVYQYLLLSTYIETIYTQGTSTFLPCYH